MRRGLILCSSLLISAALGEVTPAPAQQAPPSRHAGPYARLVLLAAKPGQEAAFEAELTARHRRQLDRSAARYTWLRLRMGGQPQYLLLRSAATWEMAVALPDFFRGEPGRPGSALPAGLVESTQSELLRHRPTLSYSP